MADAKITGLAALAADPADNDMFVIVDVSDTSMASTGTNKKLAASYLMKSSGASPGAVSQAQTFTNAVGVGGAPGSGFNLDVRGGQARITSSGTPVASPYTLSVQSTAASTWLQILNSAGAGKGAFFGISGDDFELWSYQGGELKFYTSPIAGAGILALAISDNQIATFQGYSAITAVQNVLNGELRIGGSTPYQARFSYEGATAAKLYLDNSFDSADGDIIIRTRTSGTPVTTTIKGTGRVGLKNVTNPTAWLHLPASTSSESSFCISAGSLPTSPKDGDIARGATGFTLYDIDSGTNDVINHVIANRQSSGTPAAGFGVGFAALLESSTTVDQNAGRLTFAWSTATHASRAAVGKLTAYYTSTEREAITWTADSASVTVSIAGNTQATGSVQVTGSAFASHTGGKSFNAQGAGYDGTRFWSGYLGLGAYWDATNWKTGTDGGSNGASLIIGQGSGDDLSFYTMTATGSSQQTIAHGSLASSLRLTLNASYAAFTGSVRSGYDTNLTSYFGRAAIGYNGSTSDVASFGHIDMNTSANIALFQTAAGESWFNCASGQNLIFARGGFSLGQWDTSGNLHPAVDNTVDCGKSGSRWNDIWASNATIQTSDQRDKRALQPSALGLDFVKALQPVSWVWADKGKRTHYGFIAQQVKQAMDAVGVEDFAGYIYDGETDSYSLRYSEFLSPIVKALQELLQRVERLEGAN